MATELRHVLEFEDGRKVYEDSADPKAVGDVLSESQIVRLVIFQGEHELLNCSITPPPTAANAPVWVFNGPLPAAAEGVLYDVPFDYNWAQGQSGQTIDAYFLKAGPSWLGYVPAMPGDLPRLRGTRPVGNTETAVQLTARQTGGPTSDKTVELPVVSNVTIYGLIQLTAERTLFIRTGPAGKTPPIHKLDGPAGWTDTARREARPTSPEAIDGKTYNYVDTSRTNLPAGDYVLTTEYMGKTIYASFSLGSGAAQFPLDPSETPPTARPVWGSWQPGGMSAGKAYSFTVPVDAAIIRNGQAITYDVQVKPDWLTASRDSGQRLVLSGTVPAGTTAAPKIVLLASASSGQTPKEFYAAFEGVTNRVDAMAVQTFENAPGNANSTVAVWLYWKVTGSPVVWVGMYGNGGSVLYEGVDYLTADYGDGYSRALRTLNQTRGNTLRYVARLGSSTGEKLVDKVFDTSFPATGRVVLYTAGGGSGTGQRTPVGNFSGPGQNSQVVSDNAMYSASFNRYDAATNTYFVNYIVNDSPGQGFDWRIFVKDRFYTVAEANAAGLPPFRDNIALLIRVNPNTAQSTWRNQTNPNFYSVNLSTRYE